MCLEFNFTYAVQISLRNYLEKYIVNQKILMNKMWLEFNFTSAVQILSGSVNKYVTSRDAVTS